jgi:hypothetical protein
MVLTIAIDWFTLAPGELIDNFPTNKKELHCNYHHYVNGSNTI